MSDPGRLTVLQRDRDRAHAAATDLTRTVRELEDRLDDAIRSREDTRQRVWRLDRLIDDALVSR